MTSAALVRPRVRTIYGGSDGRRSRDLTIFRPAPEWFPVPVPRQAFWQAGYEGMIGS